MGYVPGKFDWKKANALNGYSGVQEAMGDFEKDLRQVMSGKPRDKNNPMDNVPPMNAYQPVYCSSNPFHQDLQRRFHESFYTIIETSIKAEYKKLSTNSSSTIAQEFDVLEALIESLPYGDLEDNKEVYSGQIVLKHLELIMYGNQTNKKSSALRVVDVYDPQEKYNFIYSIPTTGNVINLDPYVNGLSNLTVATGILVLLDILPQQEYV